MNWEDLEAKSFQFTAKSVNWEENRELGFVRLHIFNSRISNSRKIPGPKKRELGGHTVYLNNLCNRNSYNLFEY